MALLAMAAFVGMYLAVFVLIVTLKKKKVLRKDPEPGFYPPVTVVIPAWNEEDSIQESLESILTLDYPGKIEIICVNDGSTDGTKKILLEYEKKGKIKLINKKNGGKASAMNSALKAIKTDFFVCMDADSQADREALKYMMGYMRDKDVGAATSALKVRSPQSLVQKIQWIEYLMNLLQRKIFTLLNVLYVTPGPLSVYRTKLIKKLGGFDEENLTEDMEIALKIQDAGYKIRNSTNANVYTNSPLSIYSLLNQRVRWYRGFVQNMQKYRHMFFSKKHGFLGMFMLPLTVLSILVSIVAASLLVYTIAELAWNLLRSAYYTLTIGLTSELRLDVIELLFSQNFFVVFISLIVIGVMIFLIYFSHKISGENLSFSMKIAYVIYIFLYSVLVAFVWFISIAKELFSSPRKISGWR